MEDFAKLFRCEDGGQALCFIERGTNDEPCLYWMSNNDYMTVKMGVNFPDTDAGWDALTAKFNSTVQANAEQFRRFVAGV